MNPANQTCKPISSTVRSAHTNVPYVTPDYQQLIRRRTVVMKFPLTLHTIIIAQTTQHSYCCKIQLKT